MKRACARNAAFAVCVSACTRIRAQTPHTRRHARTSAEHTHIRACTYRRMRIDVHLKRHVHTALRYQSVRWQSRGYNLTVHAPPSLAHLPTLPICPAREAWTGLAGRHTSRDGDRMDPQSWMEWLDEASVIHIPATHN